ncbi:MAG: hypothetical protein R3A48_07685 [Polyangiales bacterium]
MQHSVVPFQGQAQLSKPIGEAVTRVGVVGGAVVAVVFLFFIALSLLVPNPSESVREVLGQIYGVGATAFVGWFLYALSQAYRTQTEPITVYADGRGLALNGALVAPREAIRLAAIRLPRAASEHHTRHGMLVLDAAPMTVEVVTDANAWNLILGDYDRSAALLVAMGFAPTTLAADAPRPSTRSEIDAQRPFKLAMAVVVALSIVVTLVPSLKALLRR